MTGATGGIGRSVATRLQAEGGQLILTGRRVDLLQSMARELGAAFVAADLSDPAEVTRLSRFGRIDVLVANAGLSASGSVRDLTPDDIDEAIAVNLRAPIVMARELGALMAQRGDGHIVFIGSIGARVSTAGTAVYNATKFGLRGFAFGLRQDLGNSGIGVSIVEPGFIRDEGMFADRGARLPRGFRTSSPDQVAQAVVRAIERNVAETVVAPIETRLSVALSALAPQLSAKVQQRIGINLEPNAATDSNGHRD
ncbi:SDR family oxidoreductase [Mycobacterium sp. 852002-50816_SCH5313054-b]|uniref:SDR family NAD(P)-dependent oxidoreductase n=1 Tax=Mycobacterium sp. 852002-50816_SCH5313054-b TaxID=1834092 RepID=UPI001E534261|nr:SDR family NAD(P)-dependent oxidoreductase [Mycobacterium sp. 852002-50816_SCH5313054-b]